MMLEMRGSVGLNVVINGMRLGLLTSLVCKVSLRGDVGGASYLFGDEVTVVTSFKEVSGKLSSASIKRSVGRTDTS